MYLGVNYIKKFEVYMDMFQVVCIWGSMKIEASLGIEYVKSRSTYCVSFIFVKALALACTESLTNKY
jgi:hypothetical protein